MKKSIFNKYQKLESELNKSFLNREDEIKALILGHISMTHITMLGEPGTGKSALAREFAKAFPSSSDKLSFFEVALNSFSKPEEVFGPVDIATWKKSSELTYKSQNYLPNARIAFLDELSRGEAVLNSLLTIVNERTFNVNGVATPVPLEMAISATNFKFSSNEFEAMRDRFLQWLTPKGVDLNDETSLQDLWTQPECQVTVSISEKELETVRVEVAAVEYDTETLEVFQKVLIELKQEHGIRVSDRRSKVIVQKLIKASAWYNGRDKMCPEDLMNIWTALWSDEEQIPVIKKTIRKFVNPQAELINQIYEGTQILLQSWKENPMNVTAESVSQQLKAWATQLKQIEPKLKAVNTKAHAGATFLVEKAREKVADVLVQKSQQLGI